MNKEIFRNTIGKVLLVIFIAGLLISSTIYLNKRWAKIRDIRRQADAKSIVKALDFYNVQFGEYPENLDDDGEGWDMSNEEDQRTFLETLSKVGLLPSLIFDPKNNETHFYRYQKFNRGDFGCSRSFAVFQIFSFETKNNNPGSGSCPDMDWVNLAPEGFTWFSEE